MSDTTMPWIPALAWALVSFLWQGSVLALLLGFALRAQRTCTPNTRYLTACAALLLMAILVPLNTVRLNREFRQPPPVPSLAQPAAKSFRDFPAESAVLPDAVFPISSVKELPVGTGPLSSAIPSSEATSPWSWRSWLAGTSLWITSHAALLLWGWVTGVALLSLRLLGGAWRLARVRRGSHLLSGTELEEAFVSLSGHLRIPQPVRIFVSPTLSTALTFGWLKPIILLPASALTLLPPNHLEAILAHELAHIRRHDYLANLIQSALEVLLFYHPAVWWVSAVIRREREHCCDDLAAAACTGGRRTLARALAGLEELRDITPAAALSASGGGLLSRISRLLGREEPSPSSSTRWLGGLVAAALLVAGVVTSHASHPTASPEQEATTSTSQQPAPIPQVEADGSSTASLSKAEEGTSAPGESAPASRRTPIYSVVVANVTDESLATSLVDQLGKDGFPRAAKTRRHDGSGYSVMLGSCKSLADAEALQMELRASGFRPVGIAAGDSPSSEAQPRILLSEPTVSPKQLPAAFAPAYAVCIQSSLSKDVAVQLQQTLVNDGFTPVHLQERENGKFDVLIGRFSREAEAERTLAALRQAAYAPEKVIVLPESPNSPKQLPSLTAEENEELSAAHEQQVRRALEIQRLIRLGIASAAELEESKSLLQNFTGRQRREFSRQEDLIQAKLKRQVDGKKDSETLALEKQAAAVVEQGRNALRQNDRIGAYEYFRRARMLDPGNFDAGMELAKLDRVLKSKEAEPLPQVSPKVFSLQPAASPGEEAEPGPAAASDREQVLKGISALLERHRKSSPAVAGVRRQWYDPESLTLTLVDTRQALEEVEQFLQHPWVVRKLGGSRTAMPAREARLAPGTVLRLGDLAVRLEQVLPPSPETGDTPRAEFLARVGEEAQVLTLSSFGVGELTSYSVAVTDISTSGTAEAPSVTVGVWQNPSPEQQPPI